MKAMKIILASLFLMSGAAFAADTTAAPTSDAPPPTNESGHHHHHPKMTDAQKACFTDNGLTAPGAGAPPKDRPDPAVMEKVHACLKKNGMTHFGPPHGGPGHDGPPPPKGEASGSEE